MQENEFKFEIIRINHNLYILNNKKYTYVELIRYLEDVLTDEE